MIVVESMPLQRGDSASALGKLSGLHIFKLPQHRKRLTQWPLVSEKYLRQIKLLERGLLETPPQAEQIHTI